jgi:hypothetical protein
MPVRIPAHGADAGLQPLFTFLWILQLFMCLLNNGEFMNRKSRLRRIAQDPIPMGLDG